MEQVDLSSRRSNLLLKQFSTVEELQQDLACLTVANYVN